MRKLTSLGGLTCNVIDDLDGSRAPELIVVLAHGYGAPGDDLVSIGPALLRAVPRLADTARFIFPQAPLPLDEVGLPGGRAWWHLDVNELVLNAQRGEFRRITRSEPEGLPDARNKFIALLEQVQGETGVPLSRIVIGGFSQGSMVATDVALRLPDPPAALSIWSGTLLCEETWRRLAQQRGALSVLQSHGYYDPILPFEAATWLRDLFQESGLDVNFVEFPGMHEIPNLVLQRFVELLFSTLET